ncbi:MAG TPA: fibrobacter succinogenes major paralogous domain-containing protein [Bacteroidales bacterium]|nr:fibrobacter succinogenes major paralogous domain-containing protein [Bacteroidales bacterium]
MNKILLAGFLLMSVSAFSQEEYPNEGMPIRDLDGNVYRVIMTESGVWMAENLKTFKLNDGTPLNYVRDNSKWADTKAASYGWYKSSADYTETYGAIYNWHAVATGKLCPKGWHVPTEAEWNDLMDYAGGNVKSGDNPAKLKESGTAHWKAPNKGATNEIHFTALPAGYISFFKSSDEPGTTTNWWTATEDMNDVEPGQKPANAEIAGVSYNFNSKTLGTFQKESALPVRCKADD